MNSKPSPAIVTQDAVRRLPRWALLLLCVAYVIPGYVGREPWKNADIAAFGHMLELLDAPRWQDWLQPTLMGMPADTSALLPYWLGAWAMQLAPAWLAPDLAARIPFALMLVGTLAATWYAVYHLAWHPSAQPVAFAFGGEARPKDYARALADGALLALVATLGLAQFSHETTPALAQLCFGALVFYGLAALPFQPLGSTLALLAGLPGLALSGAPVTALVYGGLSLLALLAPGLMQVEAAARRRGLWVLLAATSACAALAWGTDLVRWQFAPWRGGWDGGRSLAQLFLWFCWPVWPLALWTLWHWRRQLPAPRQHRHLGLPLMIASLPLVNTIATPAGDRALLLALPALMAQCEVEARGLSNLLHPADERPQRLVFGPPPRFTLAGYIRRLFYAPPGYYRQIVFVVSDIGIAATTPAPTPGELRAIAKDGSAALPPGYGSVPFSWKYKVVALVYEFQKGPADGDAKQIPPTGRLRVAVRRSHSHRISHASQSATKGSTGLM